MNQNKIEGVVYNYNVFKYVRRCHFNSRSTTICNLSQSKLYSL